MANVTFGDDDGIVDEKATVAGGMIGLFVSLDSLFGCFNGSITVILLLSLTGALKTDVVVAVLNVTDVFVVKLADADETDCDLDSSTLGFGALLLFAPTLSTSSIDSSPRKKLNIIANFDF